MEETDKFQSSKKLLTSNKVAENLLYTTQATASSKAQVWHTQSSSVSTLRTQFSSPN